MIDSKRQARRSLMLLGALSMIGGAQAVQASVTTYNVTETFNQVTYDSSHPTWDTIFTGSFSFDSAANTVSNLTGSLTQAMSGNTTSRTLNYQLSSTYDSTLGGLLVTAFFQNSTDVFLGGGFATGGTKTFGNQNAYATIFVNVGDPTTALTGNQIATLAYADCTTGGLMGSTCMTGWDKITNGVDGAGGTMKGTWPITETVTAAVPEPETYAMMMAGLGIMGAVARRRRKG